MKRFAIAALLPPLVAPALVMLVMDFGKNTLFDKPASYIAQFLVLGGVFTCFFSLPYAVLLEGCYALAKARPGSVGGAIAAIGLGFCAGAMVAVLFSNVFAWGSPPGLRVDRGLLALLGGIGMAIGTFVAALVFIVERRERAAH